MRLGRQVPSALNLRERVNVHGKTAGLRGRVLGVVLVSVLMAACGKSAGPISMPSGPSTGTVDTPRGTVEIRVEGGTFTRPPSAVQGFSPPPGAQAPYGAIGFAAQVGQPGGLLTVSLTLPQPLSPGATLFKASGGSFVPIPAEVVENQVTYRVQDGGPFDADGAANGRIEDPFVVMAPGIVVAMTRNPDDPLYRAGLGVHCVVAEQDDQGLPVTVRGGGGGIPSITFLGFSPLMRDGNPTPSGLRLAQEPTVLTLDSSNVQSSIALARVPTSLARAEPYRTSVRFRVPPYEELTYSAYVNVMVTPPDPQFDIELDQTSLTVRRESSAPVELTVTVTRGAPLNLRLWLLRRTDDDIGISRTPAGSGRARRAQSLIDPPPGLSVNPGVVGVGGTKNRFTLRVSAGREAPEGTYQLVLRAMSPGGTCFNPVSADAPLQLTVTP